MKNLTICFLLFFLLLIKLDAFSQSSNDIFYNIFLSQQQYINNLQNATDYQSILSFAKNERKLLFKKYKNELNNFIIIESFNLSSGNFEGLLICKNKVFSYYRKPQNRKLKIVKGYKTNIPIYIVHLVENWNIEKISNILNQIGTTIHDGSNILATKVEFNNLTQTYNFKHIAFEEFAEPKKE